MGVLIQRVPRRVLQCALEVSFKRNELLIHVLLI